ncbi:MAG: hypothetical protein P4L41_18640 [Flavipsychrobacter sp.]|nr:hypothetical protein [Flavipsychrobacter sp.]
MKRIFALVLPMLLLLSFNSIAKKGRTPLMATHFESHKYPFELLKGQNYEGYVVYRKDTVRGLLRFKMGAVWIENGMFNAAGKYKINDRHLHAITISNREGTIIKLVKFKNFNNKFYRLVHEGKMTMYDRHFVFSKEPREVDIENMVVTYDGNVKELNEKWVLGAKKKLVDEINQVYGTNISPKDYSHDELVKYAMDLQ